MAQYTFDTLFDFEKTIIPNEYQSVEYLEGNNAPYIDLQYIAKSYSGILIRAKLYSNATASFGQVIGNRFGFSFTYSGGKMVAQYGTTYHIVSVQSVLNAVCNWTFNYLNDTYIGCNDNKISMPAIPEPSQNNLYLFCVNYNQPTEFAKQTIYYAIITENQDFVKKLYPVYRKADNVAGMYDIVNNVFYANQGTGAFSVGSDIPTTNYQNGDEIIISQTKTHYHYQDGDLVFYYQEMPPLVFKGITFEQTDYWQKPEFVFRGFSFEELFVKKSNISLFHGMS